MIVDPTVTVVCDGCANEETVDVAFTYSGYSGRSGSYDIETTLDNLRDAGWDIPYASDADEIIKYCPECAEEDEEDEDDDA